MIARGITSFKVYMTYDLLRIADDQLLDVLVAADRSRALPMVHAENHEIIKWIAKRLLERGHTAPKFHMTSHHPIAEAEATHRVIQLSRAARCAGADRARVGDRGGADDPRARRRWACASTPRPARSISC